MKVRTLIAGILVLLMMTSVAFAEDAPETVEDTESQPLAKGNLYIGAKAVLLPWGKVGMKGSGIDGSVNYNFSGGAMFVIDYAITDWFAIGGETGYLFMIPDGPTVHVSDHQGLFLLDPSFRFFYGTENIEAYFKMEIGLLMGIASSAYEKTNLSLSNGFGWNIQALPGVMYKQDGFGVFLEVGFLHGSWNAGPVDMAEMGVMLNVGFCGILQP